MQAVLLYGFLAIVGLVVLGVVLNLLDAHVPRWNKSLERTIQNMRAKRGAVASGRKGKSPKAKSGGAKKKKK